MSIYSSQEPQAKFQQLVVSVPFFANDRLKGIWREAIDRDEVLIS